MNFNPKQHAQHFLVTVPSLYWSFACAVSAVMRCGVMKIISFVLMYVTVKIVTVIDGQRCASMSFITLLPVLLFSMNQELQAKD